MSHGESVRPLLRVIEKKRVVHSVYIPVCVWPGLAQAEYKAIDGKLSFS